MNIRVSFILLLILALATCCHFSTGARVRVYQPGYDPQDSEAVKHAWMRFKQEHNKKYRSFLEEIRRFSIFKENLRIIRDLNAQKYDGFRNGDQNDDELDAAVYEPTRFADLSIDEIREKYFMKFSQQDISTQLKVIEGKRYKKPLLAGRNDLLPESFDWREHGAVGPVRDQSTCGSCYAFSAMANLEGQLALKKQRTGQRKDTDFVQLSTEHIIECDTHDCQCYGGWMNNVYEYLQESGGAVLEKDYGYCVPPFGDCIPCNPPGTEKACGRKPDYCNTTCRADAMPKPVKLTGWEAAPQDEDEIAAYLMKVGPLAAAMNANFLPFYRHGVHSPVLCPASSVNHAVLIVGFGQEKTMFGKIRQYWIVKNSWSEKWGESGYFKLARGKNKCGIEKFVMTGQIA